MKRYAYISIATLVAIMATGVPYSYADDYASIKDVYKPTLIDLEARTRATGRKQTHGLQRERLNELAPTMLVMRQSELSHNVSSKGERTVEAPSRHATCVVTQVTDCQYYSGYETLDVTPSDVFSAAEYNWKQASVVVSASGLEIDVQNTGTEQVIPLLRKRIDNAMKTMSNNLSDGVYSDGTGSSGKQITGLQALVADDPTTGTVGGINRANFSFWRNQTSGDATLTTAAEVLSEMQDMWIECTRGPDKPDLIVSSNELYKLFWESLTDIQRVTSSTEATSGFSSIKFVDADVIHDGGSGIAANHMYFLRGSVAVH